MKIILKISVVIFFILAAYSCKKEIIYEGPAGDLKGSALLYEKFSPVSDNSGIEVVIEGTSPELKTLTASDGGFMFSGLKTGLYNLRFSKQGYATHKIVSFQYLGGNVSTNLYPVRLYKLPGFSITSLKADTGRYSRYNGYVKVTLTLSSSLSEYNSVRLYVSDKPSVSYSDYVSTMHTEFASFSLDLKRLPKGKQLYMICYPSAIENEGYIDIVTGNTIYYIRTDAPSGIRSFMIPKTIY